MDSNIEALFSNITNEQMKAILKDLWKKNEEKQAKISFRNPGEICFYSQNTEIVKKHLFFLRKRTREIEKIDFR